MYLWLVRHGATEWSRSGRHTGSTDLPLLGDGEEDARRVGRRLAGHDFVRVFSSPLIRARDTARLAGFGDRVETSDLLREFDYGDYEGLTTPQITEAHPGWEVFRDGCPGGETPAALADRLDRFLALVGDPGGDVLLFGHAHCLRALATRYLDQPIEVAGVLRLDAGSVSVLGHEHEHRALLLWNERCG
ncbi:MAG TPA: histidine phosphatase family protein [Actinomycetota bacterium]|nr:histidine phosphatase family protein [Actinomycetota bacterium]